MPANVRQCPQLPTARQAIAASDRRVLVSAANAWEIGIELRLGEPPESDDIVANLPAYLCKQRFEALAVGVDHVLAAGRLPGPHRDPFDRMLMAQARIECAELMMVDPVFRDYGVAVVW